MLGIPYGGLVVNDGGAGTLALTTTPAKFAGWGALSSSDSFLKDGDPAVRPDLANNRILVSGPSNVQGQTPAPYNLYLVFVDLSGILGAAKDVRLQIYKNGIAVPGLSGRGSLTTTRANISFHGLLTVLASDLPKTIPTYPDPSATGFTGAGGFPKMLLPIELYASVIADTETLTIEAAHMTILQLR